MLASTEKQLPEIIELFPGFEDRSYFQHSDTGEFWFHATNVCKVLGFSNPTSALALHCDVDEKLMEIVAGRQTWFVSEAGCYGLAMGAKNDIAKSFKRWLKHDVLKKLRASGGYIMPNATSEQLQALKTEIVEMEKEIKRVTQLNKEVSEIDAKLVFIIKGIVDKLLEQACQLHPKGTGKHWRAYTAYWDTLYALQPMLNEIFPMELCTKQCFDETLLDEKVTELFDVIALKTQDMKWDVNYVAYKKFNMSEN